MCSDMDRACVSQVQNTFINIVSPRPETQPLSCPASRIGCLKALFGEDDSPKASTTLVKEVKEKETEDKAWRPSRWVDKSAIKQNHHP